MANNNIEAYQDALNGAQQASGVLRLDMKKIKDLKDNPLLLFINSWSVGMVEERNPDLKLAEFSRD